MQFAEFLQHSSLKRLGILYLSTCVGLGYGLRWSYFLGHLHCREQSNKPRQYTVSVTSNWLRNIHLIPIDYAFRPCLRGRLTPQISFTQEPLDFRRECLSHSLSLLMSAFSLPIPPASLTTDLHRLTERSATTCKARPYLRRTA